MSDLPKYPDVFVQLVGEDSNTGHIMGRVTRAMAEQGVQASEQQEFRLAVMRCKSYRDVLLLVGQTVSVGDPTDFE